MLRLRRALSSTEENNLVKLDWMTRTDLDLTRQNDSNVAGNFVFGGRWPSQELWNVETGSISLSFVIMFNEDVNNLKAHLTINAGITRLIRCIVHIVVLLLYETHSLW